MMKKRILASSMASVMALSSVSVVAFADEKTKDYGEAVSKADLQAFVDAEADFIANELPTYGSKQADRYQSAYDHALKVLEDEDSDAVDYNAAYQMVKSIKSKLQIYSAAQLEALIKENKAKYDKNNEFNAELQDNIYTESTFADFTSAYDDADRYVDSDDSLLITDAYIALEDAVKKLSELDTVTKSDFRKALKAYEELEYKTKNYESWRRGTLTVESTTGTSKNTGDIVSKKATVTFGDLYNMVYGESEDVSVRYWDKTEWKTLNPTEVSEDDKNDHAEQGRWIGGYDIPVGADLKEFINDQYEALDNIKTATITSNPEMVAAYKAAVDAVSVFNGWTADSYKTGSKGSCATLLTKYRPQLVETYASADIKTLITEINYKEFKDGSDTKQTGWYVDVSASNAVVGGATASTTLADSKDKKYTLTQDTDAHTLKCNMALYIVKNKSTGLMKLSSATLAGSDVYRTMADAETAAKTAGTGYVAQKISAGTNILGYMNYEPNTDAAEDDVGAVIADAKKTGGDWIDTSSSSFSSDYEDVGTATVTWDSTEYYKIKKKDGSTVATDDAVKKHNALVDKIDAAVKKFNNIKTETTNFDNILELYNDYLGYTFPDDAEDALRKIEILADGKSIAKASGSSTEWALIWRKLAYTLEDMFPVETKDKYTLNDLKKKIDEAYDVAEATGDSSLFATQHSALVAARQRAQDWLTNAKATTGYKTDMYISLDFAGEADSDTGTTLATEYKKIKDAVDLLNKWLKGFKYSYGDIQATISEVAIAIDDGKVAGDDLKKALAQCAYDLSVLEPSDVKASGDADDNVAFDSERIFQPDNRLKTDKQKSKSKPNDYEKALKTSYEALVKAYDAAKNADKGVENDFNGDGAFNVKDVDALIDALLDGKTDSKYDVDGNGTFNVKDVDALIDVLLA